jgi:GntR family transcriptional regulator, transcriptional repressor for pyruvate dehydrogenase complex
VVRQLKECIRRRIITPGSSLLESGFHLNASWLRCSRYPADLGQVLKALEVMGVLNVVQGSGAYLADRAEVILRDPEELLVPLRGHSFAEMYEARRAMEAEPSACAVLRPSDQDMEKIRAEIRKFVGHDNAFQHHIAVASGNSVFIWFIDLLQKVLAKGQLIHARSEQMQASIAEHEAILAAIEDHDPETARKEVLAHLTLSKAYSDRETGMELQVVSPRR